MIKKYLVLALSLGVMACSQHSEPSGKFEGKLIGNTAQSETYQHLNQYTWQLVGATDKNNQTIKSLFIRADMPLTLQFKDSRISITNSCNSMGGTFLLAANSLTVSNIASTMMACEAPLNELDGAISKIIEGKSTVTVNTKSAQPQLTLNTVNGETLLFKGVATPETLYGSKAETIFLEISPQTKTCSTGTRQMDCLQVKEVKYDEKGLKTYSSSQWLNFYDNIDGFKHNSNEKVIIRVKKYAIKNPPADASSFAYVLDTTIEQERVK